VPENLGGLVKAVAMDLVEGFPVLGDLVCLLHIIYLLSRDKTEEAAIIAPNLWPLPPAFGNTIVYLAKKETPF